MDITISKPFWQAVSLGALAGLRSAAAPAITSHILSHHHSANLENSPLSFMQSETTANVFKLLAVSELVADKMPGTGNRTAPQGLVFRALTGALSGASIYKANGSKAVIGALLGGSAAVASTFASFYLRRSTVKGTTLIDPIVGGIEDALVVGAGLGLSQAA